MIDLFRQFAERGSRIISTPWAFFLALGTLIVWGLCGPLFGFSTAWQLYVNSVTTIVTFLLEFIIQNTQNRDFKALQLKLDILLYASDDTHPGLIDLHNLSDSDLRRIEK